MNFSCQNNLWHLIRWFVACISAARGGLAADEAVWRAFSFSEGETTVSMYSVQILVWVLFSERCGGGSLKAVGGGWRLGEIWRLEMRGFWRIGDFWGGLGYVDEFIHSLWFYLVGWCLACMMWIPFLGEGSWVLGRCVAVFLYCSSDCLFHSFWDWFWWTLLNLQSRWSMSLPWFSFCSGVMYSFGWNRALWIFSFNVFRSISVSSWHMYVIPFQGSSLCIRSMGIDQALQYTNRGRDTYALISPCAVNVLDMHLHGCYRGQGFFL